MMARALRISPRSYYDYTYLHSKCEHDENRDELAVVLKIEHVYFEMEVYSRQFLQGRDIGKAGSGYVANFRTGVEDDMRNGRHVNLLKVRIFEELGWDSRPLLRYREQWQARKETEEVRKRTENALAAEQAARESAERERLRLEKVRADFITGRDIEPCDFIALCRLAGVPIPMRTHGTLNARACKVNIDGTVYYLALRGKRKPDLTGCHKLILACAGTISGGVNH
jgi:hypothetical protein